MYPRSGCEKLTQLKVYSSLPIASLSLSSKEQLIPKSTQASLRNRRSEQRATKNTLFNSIKDPEVFSSPFCILSHPSNAVTGSPAPPRVLPTFLTRFSFMDFHFLKVFPGSITFSLVRGISTDAYFLARQNSGRSYFKVYSNDTASRLGLGRFIGELDRVFSSSVRSISPDADVGKKPKIFLYSGHDNTIGPLLQALRVSIGGDHPAMGSAVIIELWYAFKPYSVH